MKSLKVLFGAALMLIAVVGAFTASATKATTQVYYLDANNNCVEGTVNELECPLIGAADCQLPIIELGGTAKQVWSSIAAHPTIPNKFVCQLPYDRP